VERSSFATEATAGPSPARSVTATTFGGSPTFPASRACIARQLHLFKNGERAGIGAELMEKPVERLDDGDIVAIAAYLGSLEP
jgi:hypothetical protein